RLKTEESLWAINISCLTAFLKRAASLREGSIGGQSRMLSPVSRADNLIPTSFLGLTAQALCCRLLRRFSGLGLRTNVSSERLRDWRAFGLSSILRSQSNSLKSLLSLEIRPMIIHRQNRAMIILLAATFFIYPLLAFAQRPAASQEVKYSPQLASEIKKVQQAALE